MEPTESDAAAPSRAWRWGVWHEDDRSWHAALAERNARLLPLLLPGADSRLVDSGVSIPRIIHQIWLGPREIPANCREWMKTWKALHPTWGYRLWTDEDVKALTLRNQKAFDAADNYGEKSDILRYEILEQLGGVYADVDVACLKSFESLLQSFAFVAGMANTGNVEVSNSVLLSVPYHPILKRLVDTIHQQTRLDANAMALIAQISGDATLLTALSAKPKDAAMDTIARTGPGLLTKTFMAAVGWADGTSQVAGFLAPRGELDGAIALPVELFSPLPNTLRHGASSSAKLVLPEEAMAVHYWACTWL